MNLDGGLNKNEHDTMRISIAGGCVLAGEDTLLSFCLIEARNISTKALDRGVIFTGREGCAACNPTREVTKVLAGERVFI
jgi:hypothetical protein